jgi:hypothetical protein
MRPGSMIFFTHLAQRRGFREYLAGLLAPRDRNKTLTALAGAEPVTGAQHPAVQRLQFFLSESRWDPGRVNARRLELLRADPATAPHGGGVLVIDDSGDRKDGVKTAHVGRQWLGRYGKTDNGVVTVTTLWADEARPIYHHKGESIEAHLTVVFAALAVSRWIEAQTGWSIRKFVRTARRYRTIEIRAGPHTITAADPVPSDLQAALTKISNASLGAH